MKYNIISQRPAISSRQNSYRDQCSHSTHNIPGMTPRPPHPKVLKTAMGSAEFVSLGEDEDQICTLQTVRDLKARGVRVYGVETTENSTTLWDTVMPSENIAFVFGNELIGVGKCITMLIPSLLFYLHCIHLIQRNRC